MGTVTLIHTGGTLGMAPGTAASGLVPGPSLEGILDQVPELAQLTELRMVVAFNQDSATQEPADILTLAGLIRHQAATSEGIVLIHGTDTMAYTASVLGFLLADLGKPVVITGSQRPLAYVRSDARANLADAVTLATKGVPEVGICFGDHWLRGVATDKVSVHRYEAFDSPNLPPLAELGLHVQMHPHAGAFTRQVPPSIGPALASALEIYTPFPGMPWRLPEPSSLGVLIRAFGAGNLPMERPDLAALFRHCQERELPVVITSQCPSGGVDLDTYGLGRKAQALGALSGGRHTFWAALAKLALSLGAGHRLPELRQSFATSWAGEPV